MNAHILFIISVVITVNSTGQVGINSSGNQPDPSAMLDIQSNSGGLLMPRMTQADRDNIQNPAYGLTIINTTNHCMEFYIGSAWHSIACACVAAPGTPSSGVHDTETDQIVWNWNPVSGAEGYKYHIVNDYANATDNHTSTSFTQTGLNCGNAQTIYVWAYNSCGVSSPLTLTASSDACPFVCGSTVTHGYVAGVSPANSPPYNGSYTYTTVQGNWSGVGGNKCWTRMNLGSTAEATSFTDSNADRAGWYFQFNRSQGYYHNGSVSTPAFSITNIDENSDWLPGNDPCTLLLGSGWRLPTTEEWNNFDIPVNDGAQAYASVLKHHAAGLIFTDGSSLNRGIAGYGWTDEQSANTAASALNVSTGSSNMSNNTKAFGFSVRCIHD